MAHIFVTRRLAGPALDDLRAEHDVDVWPGELPPDPIELRSHAAAADGLLCLLTDAVDAALLDACPRLRVVSNYAVGTDNIDLEACRARRISVGRTPDVLTDTTADLTLALILALARRLPEAADAVRAGEWRTWEPARWLGAELAGRRLGIVGMGRIGQAVAKRAQGFGMEVVAAERSRDDPSSGARASHAPSRRGGEDGIDRIPLTDLLITADVLSLHCPLTPETRDLVDARALARMKPTALLINTARGPIVETAALERALRAGEIGGAALDVTDPEPLPPEHSLLTAPNLIVVPHIGSATVEARHRMTAIAVANLLAGLAGDPLPHPAV